MMINRTATILLILVSLFLPLFPYSPLSPAAGNLPAPQAPSFGAPVLKWQRGGCYSSWCETGWYSSPAVVDLEGDGSLEVIAASYSLVVLDAATGALERRIDPPGDRQWPSLVVADLEGDGDLEIVTAHGGGYLNVYNHAGSLVWSRQPTPGSELRSLAAFDLDANGDLEIVVAATRSQDQWFVYEHNGVIRLGSWPQHSPDSDTNGYTAGCYNENIAAGDLDGDGRGEIFGPNDTHYLAAFQDDGVQMRASPIYGLQTGDVPKVWSRVGVHVDHAVDLRGYAICGVEHRPNFANSAPIIFDVNHDGVNEAIVVGNVYNCGTSPYTDLYEMPYILNADRTRWQGSGFDWTAIPQPDLSAAPLSEDYNQIEMSLPNPVGADLDGDGMLEILHPSYDGRLHAYWLDKSEHGAWPYSVYKATDGFYRFASEPAVADLDADGDAEVIFASWVQKGTYQTGKLHILDSLGNLLYEINLPSAFGGDDWNGALAAPTLANLDADGDLEVVLNTAHSGVVVYDLPGTSGARLLWPTGRGSYLRSGSAITGSLAGSTLSASQVAADPGDSLAYTIVLRNPSQPLPAVSLSDALPAGVTYAGGLSATSGVPNYANGAVTWNGAVNPGAPVTITFNVIIDPGLSAPTAIWNTVQIEDGAGSLLERRTLTIVNALHTFLPIVSR
jgi:uncharacterized repeat protein (TIGR01451 family)